VKSPKILIMNPFGIGDVIFSTPLIEALKETYPNCFIGYICNKRAHAVMSSSPKIDKIYMYEKDEYREIWKKSKMQCLRAVWESLKKIKRDKFEIAIDLSLGYQCSLMLKFIGIRRTIGFNYRNRGRFLSQKIDIDGFSEKHVIEYYCDMLKLLGVKVEDRRPAPKVYVTDKDIVWANDFLRDNGVKKEDMLIGVIPGCGASWGVDANYRRWGREGFAKVCDGLVDRYGAKIILLGDSKEVSICEDIQQVLKHKAVMSCGKTNLRNFLGLANRCALVVTNDGGPLHMAVGLGVRTVSIFGPVDEKIYGPYPPGPLHEVVSRKDLSCRPCYKKFKYNMCKERPCLKNIQPEDVLEAVERVFKRTQAVL